MNYDVVIIGAGPTGSTLARILAKNGYNILIFEEHSKIGLPQHCTGKISVNALRELNIEPIGVVQKVTGAVFYSPNMESFSIGRNETQAYILDRSYFDDWLSKKAVKDGAQFITNATAIGVSQCSNGVKVEYIYKGQKKWVTSKIVVGADGSTSRVARWIGLYSKKIDNMKIGIQIEATDIRDIDPNIVELYFGRKYSPGFFAWIVPLGKDKARVGLSIDFNSKNSVLFYLNNFIKNHPIANEKLKSCIFGEVKSHIIPTGGPLQKTVSDNIIIIGDAAGQVKSTTGGGLYYGLSCATIAGKVLSKVLETSKSGIIKREVLMEYDKLWKNKFLKEIIFSVKARAFLDTLTDDELSYLFKILREDYYLKKKIEIEGDIDWQSKIKWLTIKRLIKKILKKPEILYKLGKNFLTLPTFL